MNSIGKAKCSVKNALNKVVDHVFPAGILTAIHEQSRTYLVVSIDKGKVPKLIY